MVKMDFQFHIFDNNKSRELLLHILMKISESDVVAAIGSFRFRLGNLKFLSPYIQSYSNINAKELKYKYELKTGLDAELNKLGGLYVEKEEETKKRIKSTLMDENESEVEGLYYMAPGLDGLRKCISFIKSVEKGESEKFPLFLDKTNLNYLEFSIGVIWGMYKDRRMMEDGRFEWIDYDEDYIKCRCDKLDCWFSFGNGTGHSLDIFNDTDYVNHLNKIHQILDKIAPSKYKHYPEEGFSSLIKNRVLNRKEGKFYSIEKKYFEEAVYNYLQKIIKGEERL